MNKKRWIQITALAVILALGLGALLFTGQAKPMQEALDAMKSDDKVEVRNEAYITFKPKNIETEKALIIYPGGKVDPRAYAPTARVFAEQGVTTFIVKMPFNLAVFGYNKAEKVMEENQYIDNWYITGHSLGGVMAARFAKSHQESLAGLILWASYPEKSVDLSQAAMPVMSIYGTNDNLTLPGDISDTQHLLPVSVQWVSIKGGNHSQFGWYGFQKGDSQADITRVEQQQEIVEATLELINPSGLVKKQWFK